MVIYTMCVDPERGRYMALGHRPGYPPVVSFSYTSEDEAVGRLVSEHHECVEKVQHVETWALVIKMLHEREDAARSVAS
jgi:hypothetical protein